MVSFHCLQNQRHFLTSYDSMISYPNYKLYWPVRALGLYAKKFGNDEIL